MCLQLQNLGHKFAGKVEALLRQENQLRKRNSDKEIAARNEGSEGQDGDTKNDSNDDD